MKWIDLLPGDVLIDEEDLGNDYILVEKSEKRGRWMEISTGVLTPHENLNIDETDVVECFTVYRGREILQRGMDEP
jgi:hypothetical protein